VKLHLVAFTTGLYAVVIAMKGAFVPQHLSRCNDVKHLWWCTWRNHCCPSGNIHSKSKRESNLLWQYYSIEFPAHRTEFIS